MITRFAFFEGTIRDGADTEFREAVEQSLVPKWAAFPGALAVKVYFAEERDIDAPDIPMILAVDYADRSAVEAALASPVRAAARAATEEVLGRFFEGRIHHHVTSAINNLSMNEEKLDRSSLAR